MSVLNFQHTRHLADNIKIRHGVPRVAQIVSTEEIRALKIFLSDFVSETAKNLTK
jgi:hypothetical protein